MWDDDDAIDFGLKFIFKRRWRTFVGRYMQKINP